MERRNYFSSRDKDKEFMSGFMQAVTEVTKAAQSQFIAPENVHSFRHGRAWQMPAAPDSSNTGIQTHSTEMLTKHQDMVDGKLTDIDRTIEDLASSMMSQMTAMFFQTISDSCEKNGQTVDAQGKPFTIDIIIATLEKIEFGVGRDGEVQLPTLMGGAAHKLEQAYQKATPEKQKELDDLVERKKVEALERERIRRARFLGYGEA
jgi:hypothetical protein